MLEEETHETSVLFALMEMQVEIKYWFIHGDLINLLYCLLSIKFSLLQITED